jgi:hypothetical protein
VQQNQLGAGSELENQFKEPVTWTRSYKYELKRFKNVQIYTSSLVRFSKKNIFFKVH